MIWTKDPKAGPEEVVFCERCGEKLNPAKTVWIGFDDAMGLAETEEEVTNWLPFGSGCWKRVEGEWA